MEDDESFLSGLSASKFPVAEYKATDDPENAKELEAQLQTLELKPVEGDFEYTHLVKSQFNDIHNLATETELVEQAKIAVAAFRKNDVNKDGQLSYAELTKLADQLHFPLSSEEAMESMDKDDSHSLDIEEWLIWWLKRTGQNPSPHKHLEVLAKRTFKQFDLDDSNSIDKREFKRIVASLGASFTGDEISEAVEALDRNGDGTIDIEEFTDFWCQRALDDRRVGGVIRMKLKALSNKAIKKYDTDIFKACWTGDMELLKLFLEGEKEKPKHMRICNSVDETEFGEQWTALHYAVYQGYTEIVDLLLEYGADLEAKTVLGFTPLFYAAQQFHLQLFNHLLSKGADPTVVGRPDPTDEPSLFLCPADLCFVHPEIKTALKDHHKCLPPTPVPTEEIRCRMDSNGKPYMHVDLPSVGILKKLSLLPIKRWKFDIQPNYLQGMPLSMEVVAEPTTASRNSNDRATMHIPIDPDWLLAIAKNRPQPAATPAKDGKDTMSNEDSTSIQLLGKVCFMNSLGDWSPPSSASAFRYTPPPPQIEDILKPEEEMEALDKGLAKSARKLAKMLKANEKEEEKDKDKEKEEKGHKKGVEGEKGGKEGRVASKKNKYAGRPTTASSVGDRGSSPRMPTTSSTPLKKGTTPSNDKDSKASSTSKKTRPQSARPASATTSNKANSLPVVTPQKTGKTLSKSGTGKSTGKSKDAEKLPATTPPHGGSAGPAEGGTEEGEFSFAQLMLDDAKRSEAEAVASTTAAETVQQEGEFSLADLIADNERREAQEREPAPASTVQEGELSLADMMADDAARGGTGAPRVGAVPAVQEGEFSLADMMADDAAKGGASRVGKSKPATTARKVEKVSGGDDAPYVLGARVTANYQGAGSWYPGTIVKVHKDGTYDIHYDDNDKEKSIPRDYIKVTVLDVDIDEGLLGGDDGDGILNDNGDDDYMDAEYSLEDMKADRARLDAMGRGGSGEVKVKQPQRPIAPPRNRPQSAALRR